MNTYIEKEPGVCIGPGAWILRSQNPHHQMCDEAGQGMGTYPVRAGNVHRFRIQLTLGHREGHFTLQQCMASKRPQT